LNAAHFLEEADSLCNRVAIMNRGKEVVTGAPSELKAAIAKPNATLDNVFIYYTGDELASGVIYHDSCLVKTRERFTGIGQLLTMPLFFASNAIYPISLMPKWLQFISHVNPLTYQVDALRGTMLANGSSLYGFGLDCIILLLTLIGLTIMCGKLYPRLAM
jgi:hypothetical protein